MGLRAISGAERCRIALCSFAQMWGTDAMNEKDVIQARITGFWSTVASCYAAHGGNVPARDKDACSAMLY